MHQSSWEYEIVATLGPASQGEATWEAMLAAGVTGFRLNTSHLTIEQLRSWLERLQAFLSARDPSPALVLDLQGSKWRLGQFNPFELQLGQRVELVYAGSSTQKGILPVPHPDFFKAAPLSSAEIVLDDARIRLEIESTGSASLAARVTQAGEISPLKGITFASSEYRQEALPEKDQAILEQTQHLPAIRYALSYVKDAVEMARYRVLIGPSAYLIAKL
jgi:pyruvate kinase